MGYRIRYERKRRRWPVWWLAAPVLAGAAVWGREWYGILVRYVGECIRGG